MTIVVPVATGTTAWSEWDDHVLPDVPGLTPGSYLTLCIREAAIEFCERAQVWVVDHPAIDLVANTDTYNFAPPGETRVVVPTYVSVNSKVLSPTTEFALDANSLVLNWRTKSAEAPEAYFLPTKSSIRIVPTPSLGITGGLVMRVAVKPTRAASGVDDWIFDDYVLGIAAGAKARALASTKKTWSNPTMASYWKGMFEIAIGGGSMDRAKGNTRVPLRTSASFK